VAIDPGELIPIIVNLMTNALYWLERVPEDERQILIEILPSKDEARVDIRFHDSGPGVEEGWEERIFWPGITKKEEGIGMGLTVAPELVAQYNGKMYLIKPGELQGASLGFDLPLTRK
jgi:sensor histidine kinase regulating citrate/malate metabolism